MFSAAPGTRDPQSFDHLPARYHRYAELVGAELRTWLRFHLPIRAGRGLDAGCGTGLHTELLAERCFPANRDRQPRRAGTV
jgi:trans-aconitate methyltransferase